MSIIFKSRKFTHIPKFQLVGYIFFLEFSLSGLGCRCMQSTIFSSTWLYDLIAKMSHKPKFFSGKTLVIPSSNIYEELQSYENDHHHHHTTNDKRSAFIKALWAPKNVCYGSLVSKFRRLGILLNTLVSDDNID